jgi:hypothetical protein
VRPSAKSLAPTDYVYVPRSFVYGQLLPAFHAYEGNLDKANQQRSHCGKVIAYEDGVGR